MKHNQYMKIILFDNGKFRRGKLLVDRASAKKTCLAYIKAQVCKSLFPKTEYCEIIGFGSVPERCLNSNSLFKMV